MFFENKKNAKINLHGNIMKSFFVILLSFLSFFVCVLSCFCCVYFLLIDTSFLAEIGVFNNQYALAGVCAFAIAENIFLLLFSVYVKLRKDCYFYSLYENNIKKNISVVSVIKAFYVFAIKSLKKITALILFLLPFTVVSAGIIFLLKKGISHSILSCLIICAFSLLSVGLYSYAVYVQKFYLVTFVFLKNKNTRIKEIFELSEKMMNNKCKKILKLKIINLPKKLLCLLVIPAIYYLPYCKVIETDFSLQNEKPHMRRKSYAEKPIVFYFKPIKEN